MEVKAIWLFTGSSISKSPLNAVGFFHFLRHAGSHCIGGLRLLSFLN